MDDYHFERLSRENIHHLQELYRSAYSKIISLETLQGKYDTKLFGVEWLGYLAFTQHKNAVAFYGVIPCYFKFKNEVFLVAQSADTMTHPDHRRKGLFVRLAKMTYDLARQEGVEFIFGFPNQNSYPGFVKLNWKFLPSPMQLFVLKGSGFSPVYLSRKIGFLKKLFGPVKMTREERVEKDLSSGNGIIRDALFLRYKSQYTATFFRSFDGSFTWLKNDGALKVGLVDLGNPSDALTLRDHLRDTAKILGCRSIVLMTSKNSQLFDIISTIAKPRDGLAIGFYKLTDRNIDFSQVSFEYCDIDIF